MIEVVGVSPDKVHVAKKKITVFELDDFKSSFIAGHSQLPHEEKENGDLHFLFTDNDEKNIEKLKTLLQEKEHKKFIEEDILLSKEDEEFLSKLNGRVKSRTEAIDCVAKKRIPMTHEEMENAIHDLYGMVKK